MTSAAPRPDGEQSPRLRFAKAQHLRKPAEFERVYALKQRASDARLLVFAARNDLGLTRIGLSVSRKHGGAVQRHRLQRRLREAFRLRQHELPAGLDLVLIPHVGETAGVQEYGESLVRLARKLDQRLAKLTAAQAGEPQSAEGPS
jgi:ribonuclease P protein component